MTRGSMELFLQPPTLSTFFRVLTTSFFCFSSRNPFGRRSRLSAEAPSGGIPAEHSEVSDTRTPAPCAGLLAHGGAE